MAVPNFIDTLAYVVAMRYPHSSCIGLNNTWAINHFMMMAHLSAPT